MVSFLYCSPYSYRSSNNRDSKSWLFRDNFGKSNQEKKQRCDIINEEKKIKSDNLTRSNREKFNIAIAIWEKRIIG